MPDTAESALVRPAHAGDLEAVVQVHMEAFRGFLLTKMGPGFLRRYYATVLDYPHGVLLVATGADGVIGFACGFAHPEGFSRRLKRQALLLVPHVAWGVVRHPEVALAAFQNALGVFRQRPVGYEANPRDFELSSLGVAPRAQGRGVGQLLVRAIVQEARKLGVAGVYLSTDVDENERANRLYSSAGFQLQNSYIASGGRRRHYYRMAFEDEHVGSQS